MQCLPPADLAHGRHDLDSTKVALTTWFRAMYLITQTKQGISSIELGRRLGVTQTTAWKIKTKLTEVMRIAGESVRLDGRIEMDDAYLGGQHSGGKTGRGSPGKKPIVVAVQTSEDGRPRRIKLRRIARFKRKRVKSMAKKIIAEGATVFTDWLKCFRGVADAGCRHIAFPTGSCRRAARHPAFKWANTMLGNIKTSIAGTYRAIRKKHMVRYPCRVRVALQSPLRSCRHDPDARPRRSPMQTRHVRSAQVG